jgi:hypothetical protein
MPGLFVGATMPAYQVLEPGQVYHTALGIDPAAGGSLTFYAPTTTTPVNTWSNPALSTLNTNPVVLDSAGRASVEIWMSDAVDVVLKDADGATVWSRRIQPQVQTGGTIPTLQDGEFLTNDGTNLSWQPILQVPDPTGSEGYQLTVTGGLPTWVAPVAPEAFAITVAGSTMTVDGTGGKIRHLVGSATGTNTGGRTQTVNVTFSSAFSSTPGYIGCSLTNASQLATYTNNPSWRVSSKSTTGFTVVWVMGEIDDSRSEFDFNAGVAFDYLAIGPVA